MNKTNKSSLYSIKTALTIIFTFLVISIGSVVFKSHVSAKPENPTFLVYFTGVGCPHCTNVDSVLLNEWLIEYPELIVVEYEIYQLSQNAQLIDLYNSNYNCGLSIPLVIFNKSLNILGDNPILSKFEEHLSNNQGNKLPLYNGSQASIDELDFHSLPLYPKIWTQNRIALKVDESSEDINDIIEDFLMGKRMDEIFKSYEIQLTNSQPVHLSGSEINFEQAAKIDGWILQWNGEFVEGDIIDNTEELYLNNDDTFKGQKVDLTKTMSLAFIDAVNPCALAVLTMMLITIITYNPRDKKNIILAGLAFTLSVFIMYMIYGLIIIRLFKLVQAITSIRLILYKILAVIAIILGILEIKDFISYKAGGFGTEMPMFLRPKVKKIISQVTSPAGAFGVGLFVTVFLLPCTIGPYIILGGMLSFSDTFKTLPYLIIYNLIFVLPMLVITLIVYFGIRRVEDISKWKEKNIRKLHLISGGIILLLGIAMILGWV